MKLLKFDIIDSTNTYGKTNFDILEDKTAIVADKQTHGKGRFNRVWVSENSENIYLSLILKPKNTQHIANFTQYMSVAAAKVLEEYDVAPRIKWPNDVLINNKKICGILSEGILKNNKFEGLVLGIGINLNCDEQTIKNIDKPATSLNIETGEKINKEEFLKKLLKTFFENYEKAAEYGFECFKQEYLDYADFLGRQIYIQNNGEDAKKQYFARDIDNQGNLVVVDEQNREKIILSGDLIY